MKICHESLYISYKCIICNVFIREYESPISKKIRKIGQHWLDQLQDTFSLIHLIEQILTEIVDNEKYSQEWIVRVVDVDWGYKIIPKYSTRHSASEYHHDLTWPYSSILSNVIPSMLFNEISILLEKKDHVQFHVIRRYFFYLIVNSHFDDSIWDFDQYWFPSSTIYGYTKICWWIRVTEKNNLTVFTFWLI